MKRNLLLISILLLTLNACASGGDAPPDQGLSLHGQYTVNGSDPQGNEYGGRLIITQTIPGEYHLHWIITDSIQEGTGLLTDNQLTATWRTVAGFSVQQSGTAKYTLTSAGELYGTKTIDGQEGKGTETAYPISLEDAGE